MMSEQVELNVTVPRIVWQALHDRAQTERADESALLLRALEQFLYQSTARHQLDDQLARECEQLAHLVIDDIGTDDEWLVVQNQALLQAETELN